MKKSYAVITGASSGIGMAFARQLAAEGYRLVLVARREDRLQELAQELQKKGTESIVISADLSQKEACYHLMQQIEKLPVGILINDAGFGDCGSFLETDADKEMQMIDVKDVYKRQVSVMLILFGIAFILIENSHKGKNSRINSLADIGYDTALFIGLFQLIAAIFPGTSRSGATIVGALLIGVSRTVAAEYTFFLAIPVMFGASILKIAKFGLDFSTSEVVILFVGCVIAFAVSLIVIRFLMGYIKKHDFKVFGYYRIILGIFVLACGFLGRCV